MFTDERKLILWLILRFFKRYKLVKGTVVYIYQQSLAYLPLSVGLLTSESINAHFHCEIVKLIDKSSFRI
jgi:hypothetical protein